VVRRALPLLAAALAAAGLWPGAALAQPFPRQDLPPELRPWVPWVLDQVSDFGCAHVRGQAVCAWPGRLRLALAGTGGAFALDVQADRDTELRLPGSAEAWPQDVTVDGHATAVFDRGATPRLRLTQGRHRLSGRFVWSRLPESLGVPPEIGLVDLTLDGRPVARPRRDAGGLLWLRARAETGAAEADRLRLQVFRHVQDGVPLFVETRLQLDVSGRARETTLGQALLPGTTAVAVSGALPARVENGLLRVQLRPGTYTVSVLARVDDRPEALARPKAKQAVEKGAGADVWPAREVWVFAADERLRQVDLSGPTPIDPSRTELPDEWRNLPAFLVDPGGRLVMKTTRRGQPEAAPDALRLSRVLWLDPDGRGATVRDSFSGTLHSTTRLDLLPPGRLGRVAIDGQDQLVTADPKTSSPGVELRRASLDLEADSRLAFGGALPAVGWSTGVDALGATLNLPPGWSLLAASGVDSLPGTWTSRFTLLSFFFILLVAFGVYRLFGLRDALLATATLVLTHGEPGAPFLVWLSLVCAIALRRVSPTGRLGSLGRIWFLASALFLLVLLVPFTRDQVKDALFPQVATPVPVYAVQAGEGAGVLGEVPSAPAANEPPRPALAGKVARRPPAARAMEADRLEELKKEARMSVQAAPPQEYTAALEQDPKAVLQTGPGVPTWSWRRYSLGWTGPVSRDHRMRLVLASPGLNRALTALRLVLLGLLSFVLLSGRWPTLPRRRAAEAVPVAAALGVFLLFAAAPVRAQSGTPPAEILEELKRRLTRPAPCEPECVTSPSLILRLLDGRLQVSAEVDAAADGTWAVPGPLASFSPADVRLDGAPAVALALLGDGFLHVRLSPGVHRLEAVGPVPPGDSFTLQFGVPPRRARAEAPGWDVSGLRSDGPPDRSILFARRLSGPRAAMAPEGQYPPWLQVTRTLRFGVSWTVETRVERVTPVGTPVALRVPLLEGEAPTRADLTVERGEAVVSLGRDELQTRWQSTLKLAPQVRLRAPEGRPWSEVWRLECSPIWSCSSEGLAPVDRFAEGVFAPEYHPWPGETLAVALARPQGVEGQTLTLDAVQLEATPGTRMERVRLVVSPRASREQPLKLHLPAEAEVQQVTLDGSERPTRPEQGELRVTVPAGAHRLEVVWQQPHGIGLAYAVPRVGLSGPAVNVTEQLTLPPSRWLLLTWGPAWGPAVLFWPYLVFLLAVAAALGRLRASALTSVQWALLGLGLSQVSALAALVVAGFVFALSLRQKRPPRNAAPFDLLQLLLVLWAVVGLGILYSAIHTGLLFRPDMQVAGNGSTDTVLRWYADRVGAATPSTGVLSVPLWVYRAGMLAWALWLAASLVRSVGWGFRAFGEGGFWRSLPLRRASTPPPSAPPDAPGAGEPGATEGGPPAPGA
jgi:hypothetical protein